MRAVRNYFKNFFNSHQPSEKIKKETYDEMSLSLNKAFALPSLNNYSKSLSLKGLLVKAVEMFVGSRAMPKNHTLSRQLIAIAEQKATTDKQKCQIEYFKYFFLRIDAFKNGRTTEFDLSTEMLNKLAEEKHHPQSCYLVGKQLVNLAMSSSNQKERKQMVKLAAFYFELSLTDNQYGGLYYLGQIMKNTEYTTMTEDEVRQFYIYGAAMGDPMCYFLMSQIYLREDKQQLYLKYLKMAAEAGVIEAQHNLGCQYLQGKKTKKDEIKALSWFIHAAAHGFIQAKYNVVYLFLKGSQCGRIKVNKKVALLNLQQLQKIGQDVDDKIKELVESQQKEQEQAGKQPA